MEREGGLQLICRSQAGGPGPRPLSKRSKPGRGVPHWGGKLSRGGQRGKEERRRAQPCHSSYLRAGCPALTHPDRAGGLRIWGSLSHAPPGRLGAAGTATPCRSLLPRCSCPPTAQRGQPEPGRRSSAGWGGCGRRAPFWQTGLSSHFVSEFKN